MGLKYYKNLFTSMRTPIFLGWLTLRKGNIPLHTTYCLLTCTQCIYTPVLWKVAV